jgi:large subunit ribosomal protein L14
MIQVGSILKVSDKTGVVLVQCIKVLGNARKRIAFLGDVILVTVQRLIPLDLKM